MIDKVTKIVTNFAKSENPSGEDSNWKQECIYDFKCLNISEKKFEIISMPEKERLKIWNRIFEAERRDLY